MRCEVSNNKMLNVPFHSTVVVDQCSIANKRQEPQYPYYKEQLGRKLVHFARFEWSLLTTYDENVGVTELIRCLLDKDLAPR
jgi:hypothetical protein